MKRPFVLYYAATVVFVVSDYLLGVTVRIAFLQPRPVARLAYYGLCFACLSLMLRKPAWAVVTAAIESLRGTRLHLTAKRSQSQSERIRPGSGADECSSVS